MSHLESSEPDPAIDNLNRALPPERADIDHANPFFNRAIERLLTDHMPSPTGSSMETLEQQIRQRRELFGNDYIREYGSPAVRQILRDHALEAPQPKRNRAKQSRRLP